MTADERRMEALHWPAARLGEATEVLARRAGLRPTAVERLPLPDDLTDGDSPDLEPWLEWAGEQLTLDITPVDTRMSGYAQLLAGAAPAIVQFHDGQTFGFYLILASKGRTLKLIGPDHRVRKVDADAFRRMMVRPYEAHLDGETNRVLDQCDLTSKSRAHVRDHLMQARIGHLRIGRCWMLRPTVTGPLHHQLRSSRWLGKLGVVLAVLFLAYGLEVAGWGMIGNVTLNGRLDMGWLSGWILMLASLVPLRTLSVWLEQGFALDTSQMLKQRTFAGALRLDVDAFKAQGVGQLLGRVIESQAMESLALNGGMGVVTGLVQLVCSLWVLSLGAGGLWHVFLLLGWLAISLGLSAHFIGRLKVWTQARLKITQDLIESMLGHRTRMVQEPQDRRNLQEDRDMKAYLDTSHAMDAAMTPLLSVMPSGWMIVALLGLAPALLAGHASTPALAISLGGVLLANGALGAIAGGMTAAARAGLAWSHVAELFKAAAAPQEARAFLSRRRLNRTSEPGRKGKLVDANQITYRHAPNMPLVLKGVDLSISHGERILLCGESGGGKSTLASILTGLRKAEGGLMLMNGLDRHTIGAGWHRLACEAPQFHENHILSGPIGLNLLMGRNWPASEGDLREARDVCNDLGLSGLLDRMPGGMNQMVGETGWQLSHGEKSRIFLARALLQKAPLTVLDESFAALDPENLKLCVTAAFKRSGTLMVIAHP